MAVVPLRYVKAAKLAPLLATLMSPWGTIAVDERTNGLIIRDIPESPIFQ
jgi:type II secretory pathway component GspD/PulD (secretin)